MATNNLYAALLRKGGGPSARKVAGEAVKKLDAFMERSGGWSVCRKSVCIEAVPAIIRMRDASVNALALHSSHCPTRLSTHHTPHTTPHTICLATPQAACCV